MTPRKVRSVTVFSLGSGGPCSAWLPGGEAEILRLKLIDMEIIGY
jgi:hypothetical protein